MLCDPTSRSVCYLHQAEHSRTDNKLLLQLPSDWTRQYTGDFPYVKANLSFDGRVFQALRQNGSRGCGLSCGGVFARVVAGAAAR